MNLPTNNQTSNEKWVLLATVLASGMAFIDATALNVALPAIQSQLQASGTELLWIVNAYAVVTAALILFGGALGDGFGRARVFGIGIGLFVIASLGCGLSATTQSLIIARVFQGLGAALMIPGSLSLISTTFEPSRRGRAIGIWSACSVVMSALGPIVGGLFADAGLWRAIFFINLPIGLLCLAVLITKVASYESFFVGQDPSWRIMSAVRAPGRVLAYMRSVLPTTNLEGPSKITRSLDYVGAILSILGLASLNYGLLEVASRGWSDPVVIAAFVVSVCSLVAFVWNESRSAHPLLPLSLFRNRTLVAASQLTLCFYSGLYGMLFFLALNLIQVQHYPASVAGLAQLPVMLLVILLSPVAGKMVDRYGPRVPLMCGGVLATLGFLLLARPGLTSGPSDYWVHFFPPLALLGMAMGMSAAPLSTTIMNSVPQGQVGVGSGINSTLSRLSGVLGLAVLGPIAIISFSRSLMLQSKSFSLSGEAFIALRQESRRLADAMPPSGMSPEMTGAVEQAIRFAYVDAFRIVTCVSAIMVGLSTVLAAALIERRFAHE